MIRTNIFIIALFSSLSFLTAEQAHSQIQIRTGNTTVRTNSSGGVSVSTPNTSINVSDDWDDYYYAPDTYYSSDKERMFPYGHSISEQNKWRQVCYQRNRQMTRISGSHRGITQRRSFNCN